MVMGRGGVPGPRAGGASGTGIRAADGWPAARGAVHGAGMVMGRGGVPGATGRRSVGNGHQGGGRLAGCQGRGSRGGHGDGARGRSGGHGPAERRGRASGRRTVGRLPGARFTGRAWWYSSRMRFAAVRPAEPLRGTMRAGPAATPAWESLARKPDRVYHSFVTTEAKE